MKLPGRITQLPEYPFPRLRRLLDGESPGNNIIDLSVGEPKHPFPEWIISSVAQAACGFGSYPPNYGSHELLSAISTWIKRRYDVGINPESQILALNGSREGLFNASLALCPESKNNQIPYILIPNPFYPAYAAGAIAAGAIPYFVAAERSNGYLPAFDSIPQNVLNQTALLYICSPSNPQGAVASEDYLKSLIKLSENYGFRILSDECYSEIYREYPPTGLLSVSSEMQADPEKAIVIQSLSKRSCLPGLRSGFVAGGEDAISAMKKLRSYGGTPISTPLLAASVLAWNDESHVEHNRRLYQAKYQLADKILGGFEGYFAPRGGLFLWLDVGDGEATALRLWRQNGLRVLPGSYLGRTVNGKNPGSNFIRAALVAKEDELTEGLERLLAAV